MLRRIWVAVDHDRVGEFRRRVDVGFAAAGQDSRVAVARGEHPQAVPHAAAPGQAGHSGAHRLGGDPELLQVAAELTRRLGQLHGRLATEQAGDRIVDKVGQREEERVGVAADARPGVDRQHQHRGGDPDDRADRGLLDPQQQQTEG